MAKRTGLEPATSGVTDQCSDPDHAVLPLQLILHRASIKLRTHLKAQREPNTAAALFHSSPASVQTPRRQAQPVCVATTFLSYPLLSARPLLPLIQKHKKGHEAQRWPVPWSGSFLPTSAMRGFRPAKARGIWWKFAGGNLESNACRASCGISDEALELGQHNAANVSPATQVVLPA